MRFANAAKSFAQSVMPMTDDYFKFSHAKKGLTRFPPNVEQISVEHESLNTWLVTRRNDVELRFPLDAGDCEHLAALLTQKKA